MQISREEEIFVIIYKYFEQQESGQSYYTDINAVIKSYPVQYYNKRDYIVCFPEYPGGVRAVEQPEQGFLLRAGNQLLLQVSVLESVAVRPPDELDPGIGELLDKEGRAAVLLLPELQDIDEQRKEQECGHRRPETEDPQGLPVHLPGRISEQGGQGEPDHGPKDVQRPGRLDQQRSNYRYFGLGKIIELRQGLENLQLLVGLSENKLIIYKNDETYQQRMYIEPRNVDTPEYFLEVYQKNKITLDKREQVKQSVEQLTTYLSRINLGHIAQSYTNAFGSIITDFGTLSSDIDFTLLTNNYSDERRLLKYIHKQLINLNATNRYKMRGIYSDNVRVPLLSITDTLSKTDIDLCINNILGVINTQMLRIYASLHPLISQAGVLLKVWGKARHFIAKANLSSYALIIMLIYFLQTKYSLPNLQKDADQHQNTLTIKRIVKEQVQCFTTNPYFETNTNTLQKIKDMLEDKWRDLTIDKVLLDFMVFYSYGEEFYKGNRRIQINGSRQERLNKDVPFSMVDPFDKMHDPGERVKEHLIEEKNRILVEGSQYLRKREYDKLFK